MHTHTVSDVQGADLMSAHTHTVSGVQGADLMSAHTPSDWRAGRGSHVGTPPLSTRGNLSFSLLLNE